MELRGMNTVIKNEKNINILKEYILEEMKKIIQGNNSVNSMADNIDNFGLYDFGLYSDKIVVNTTVGDENVVYEFIYSENKDIEDLYKKYVDKKLLYNLPKKERLKIDRVKKLTNILEEE